MDLAIPPAMFHKKILETECTTDGADKDHCSVIAIRRRN